MIDALFTLVDAGAVVTIAKPVDQSRRYAEDEGASEMTLYVVHGVLGPRDYRVRVRLAAPRLLDEDTDACEALPSLRAAAFEAALIDLRDALMPVGLGGQSA